MATPHPGTQQKQATMPPSDEFWIYHERQEAALCGQHALNNLVQACEFSPGSLSDIAHQLDQMELNYMAESNEGGIHSRDYLQRVAEGSGNVDEQGNFSIEVLRSALLNKYNLSLPNIQEEGVMDSMDVAEMEGFICNRSSHWFAIRKINGRFWNLNSTAERPELISHFRLAAELTSLQDSGYSVFCVTKRLPPPCTSSAGRERGLPQYWWKESDLVMGKSDATTAASDPWKNVGSGMRLDGKPANNENGSMSSSYGQQLNAVGDLTEDELLQMAVHASLEQAQPSSREENKVPVPPEPSADEAGAVRIQFRMPDGGGRVIRRFLETESVGVVYAFVEESCAGHGKRLELRSGFPPSDLAVHKDETIKEAKLSGETIQGRYV